MADGLHSLSDLLSDMLVLYANRHGNRHADANHPYGHARVETAATLILGTFLAVLGVVLLVAASRQAGQADALQTRCDELLRDDELFRAIHVHRSHAQN